MRRRGGGLSFGKKRRRINVPLLKEIGMYAIQVIITVALAFLFVYYFGMRTRVIGNSMMPQFDDGEQILTNKFVYVFGDPKPNDVIVFLPNGNTKSHYYIKRVVGVPGDKVQIREGILYVNGTRFEEKIDVSSMEYAGLAENVVELGKDEFFVLGDNRNSSEDSRYANIGIVKKEYIVGKCWLRIYPIKKFKYIR